MRYFRIPLVLLLTFVLTSIAPSASFAIDPVVSQGQSTALERGYRTGYSDGYNAGFRDVSEKAPRDFQNKEEYQRADRSYNDVWGPVEDYRDGYQQGFEKGYVAGYDHQTFDSTIPSGFRRRGAVSSDASSPASSPDTPVNPTTDNSQPSDPSSTGVGAAGNWSIPRDTVLMVELQTPLSTEATQPGDRFQARVVEPAQFANAVVEGRVTTVRRPGKVKGVAELQLSFDQIRWPNNRSSSFHAQLIEVMPMGRDGEPDVDREGGVRGRDSTKDDVSKVGAATGIGAIIGAIAGGGKGAAIGAVIGGGVGTAGVMSQRGKDIRLERGQQLKIRTSTDTSDL